VVLGLILAAGIIAGVTKQKRKDATAPGNGGNHPTEFSGVRQASVVGMSLVFVGGVVVAVLMVY